MDELLRSDGAELERVDGEDLHEWSSYLYRRQSAMRRRRQRIVKFAKLKVSHIMQRRDLSKYRVHVCKRI